MSDRSSGRPALVPFANGTSIRCGASIRIPGETLAHLSPTQSLRFAGRGGIATGYSQSLMIPLPFAVAIPEQRISTAFAGSDATRPIGPKPIHQFENVAVATNRIPATISGAKFAARVCDPSSHWAMIQIQAASDTLAACKGSERGGALLCSGIRSTAYLRRRVGILRNSSFAAGFRTTNDLPKRRTAILGALTPSRLVSKESGLTPGSQHDGTKLERMRVDVLSEDRRE